MGQGCGESEGPGSLAAIGYAQATEVV